MKGGCVKMLTSTWFHFWFFFNIFLRPNYGNLIGRWWWALHISIAIVKVHLKLSGLSLSQLIFRYPRHTWHAYTIIIIIAFINIIIIIGRRARQEQQKQKRKAIVTFFSSFFFLSFILFFVMLTVIVPLVSSACVITKPSI